AIHTHDVLTYKGIPRTVAIFQRCPVSILRAYRRLRSERPEDRVAPHTAQAAEDIDERGSV
ncbi:MAG: hypothetical protein ACXWEN_11465, partial [Actinomycetota bacterium]